MYSYLTAVEADYRRDQIAEQFRNAQRRHRRPVHSHSERRWHVGRQHSE